jgi:uncharacterized protein YbaP (TraB family)
MKPIYYFCIGLFSFSVAFAQNKDHPAQAQLHAKTGSGEPLANTLLWKITGANLKEPSYLFGTMHILCAGNAKLSDSLTAIINHTDEIYFEINLDDLSGMMGAMKFMRMNDNKKLSDLLDSADYAKVKNYFEKHAAMMPFSMLERFKPLLVSSLIAEAGLDCKATDGMELMIMKDAHAAKKKIRGLETAEYQAGLVDSIPYIKQARDLINSIDSAEENKKLTAELETVYLQQDLAKIDELTQKGDPGDNNYLDLLVYQRNRNWAASLDTLMPQKSLLIAVGAGHLPGEQGLIKTLRKKGYILSPLKN